jgi:RNA polymerase sigma factor (sigma-70 family)
MNKENESCSWAKLRQGNIVALNELYDIYIDLLYEYGLRCTKDSEYIMDCIHDLFLDLYKYRKKLSPEVNVESYLLKSLKRKINARFKSKIVFISPEEDYSASVYKNQVVSIEEVIIQEEQKAELHLCLDHGLKGLTNKQQEIISMRFNENQTYEEIAIHTGVSIETARTGIYRAIKQLRQKVSY